MSLNTRLYSPKAGKIDQGAQNIWSQCATCIVKENPSVMQGDSVAHGIATVFVSFLPYSGLHLDASV